MAPPGLASTAATRCSNWTITIAAPGAWHYDRADPGDRVEKSKKRRDVSRYRTYAGAGRPGCYKRLLAGLLILSQLLLFVGPSSSFAQTGPASAALAVSSPFGPMVICTPQGIQILYPDSDGPDDGQDGPTGVKCPLCLIATSPYLVPTGTAGLIVFGETAAFALVWGEAGSCDCASAPRSNHPARAPPFALFS